ncbi:transposable element Tcb2 transposase [Trichonephila clavipes]|nr:transposable element Tcb2 transposase [Trichonephila clavipes]
MVWGAIAYDSRSTLIVMRGILTGQRYVDDILRPHVGPFLNGLPGAIFQQDNARPHTARAAQDFLCHFQTLSWPARFPDLSPVEHVWDQLKLQMPSCHSVHDLELAVQDLWAHLPQDSIRYLINSMPDRVAACIAAGGPGWFWEEVASCNCSFHSVPGRLKTDEIYLTDPFGEYSNFPNNRRPEELYMASRCHLLIIINKIRVNCTREKANIGIQDFIPTLHSSHSAFSKDTEVCAAIQRDACPDHQAFAIVMVHFSDIGGYLVGLWFSPYESTALELSFFCYQLPERLSQCCCSYSRWCVTQIPHLHKTRNLQEIQK